jgi:hypothetical protein
MPQHQEVVLDLDTPQYWPLVGCKTTASPEQAAAIIDMYSSDRYMFVAEKCNKSFNTTRFAIIALAALAFVSRCLSIP